MNEHDLRSLARRIVADKISGGRPAGAEPGLAAADLASAWRHHASHGVYVTIVNTSDACVIEPDVPCHHCDYCKSHGH